MTLEYEYFPFDNQLLDTEGADRGYGTRGLTYSQYDAICSTFPNLLDMF